MIKESLSSASGLAPNLCPAVSSESRSDICLYSCCWNRTSLSAQSRGPCPSERWSPQAALLRPHRAIGQPTFVPKLHQPLHSQEWPIFCFYSNQMSSVLCSTSCISSNPLILSFHCFLLKKRSREVIKSFSRGEIHRKAVWFLNALQEFKYICYAWSPCYEAKFATLYKIIRKKYIQHTQPLTFPAAPNNRSWASRFSSCFSE